MNHVRFLIVLLSCFILNQCTQNRSHCTMPIVEKEINQGKPILQIGDQTIYEGQIQVMAEVMPGFQEKLDSPNRKQEVISQLIEQELFLQKAIERDLIKNNPRLQKNLWVQIRNYQAGTYLLEEIDARAQNHYEKQKKDLFTQVPIKDIVFLFEKTGQSDPEKQRLVALEKAYTVHQQLTPENFSEMAQKHTDHPIARVNGGDIGQVSMMDDRVKFLGWKPLVETAFNLSTLEVSDPIETDEGIHIIQVAGEPSVQSFESVKGIIRNQLEKEVKKELLENMLAHTKIEYLDDRYRPAN